MDAEATPRGEIGRSPPAGAPETAEATGLAAGLGRRPALSLAALVLFCLALFVPGIAALPPVDRDEPRYTQATKQMLETGDVVDIRFQDAARHKKPVGIYWLQAASATLSGLSADAPLWVYRVPSVLGALLAVLLTAWAARAVLPPGEALLAAFLLAACMILAFEARIAKTDAALLATVVAANGALARIWRAGREAARLSQARAAFLGPPLVLWLALAVSVLVKGPIGPMVVALTALGLLALDRAGWRWIGGLRPLPGLLVLAAIALPWFVAIGLATDGAFYAASVGNDLLGKTQGGAEGHWGPPGYHLAFFWVVAWPMSALVLLALPAMAALRASPAGVLAVAWAVPTFLVFELVPTKLPHYTLPALPGVAILLAAALSRPGLAPGRWPRRLAAGLLALVAGGAFAAAFVLPLLLSDPVAWTGAALAAGGLALAVLAARAILSGLSGTRVVAGALGSALLLYVAAFALVLPRLETVWLAPRLAAAFEAASDCPDPVPISVGYREPSLVFLTRTDIRLSGPAEAAAALARLPCAIAAVDARHLEAFRAAAEAAGLDLGMRATVGGFNISKGDFLDLTLYQPVR